MKELLVRRKQRK